MRCCKFSSGRRKRRVTREMFVIWRRQNWSHAIRWKIAGWLQRQRQTDVSWIAIKNNIVKDVSSPACVACQGKRGRQNYVGLFSWSSRTQNSASVASVDLGCIWPWFNLRLAWAGSGTSLGPDPSATLAHICHSRPGEEAVLSEAPARYTALVTVLASRQGFLFGSQLKRTTVRKRTEGCVWASVCETS